MKVYFPKDQINTRALGPPTLLHCLNILLDFVQIWKKPGTAEGGTDRLPISKETSLMGSDTAGNYDKSTLEIIFLLPSMLIPKKKQIVFFPDLLEVRHSLFSMIENFLFSLLFKEVIILEPQN